MIQAAVAAFNWNDMDGLVVVCTEDLVVIPFEDWPDDPVYHGHDGIKRLAGGWWENFDGTHIEVERTIDAGTRMVALLLMTGIQQGVRVEQRVGSIFDFRDELIARIQFFLGYEGALEAAGV